MSYDTVAAEKARQDAEWLKRHGWSENWKGWRKGGSFSRRLPFESALKIERIIQEWDQ